MTFNYLNIVNITLMQIHNKPKDKGSITRKSNCKNKARAIIRIMHVQQYAKPSVMC